MQYIKNANNLHFPHLLLFKIISNFIYKKLHPKIRKIYLQKQAQNNKDFIEKLKILRKIPISKLIKDLKLKQDFAIICIKPNDSLRANLFEYYQIKEKYSNIRSCESDFENDDALNDLGNYRVCLETLQSLSSSNTIFQAMVII